MKSFITLLILCSVVQIKSSAIKREAKYPRFQRSCYRNMPTGELDDCLKFNFQQSLPTYRSAGIPGIINGSIDPHTWPRFYHYFGGALIQGSLTISDAKMWGWSALRVLQVRTNVKNPEKMLVDMDFKVPKLDMFGQFKLEARLGAAKFYGEGPFWLNLTGVSGTWKVSGSRERGAPYMEIKSFKGRPSIETFKLKAKGAALGNERLSNLVIATINRGWRIFHEIANPAIVREWGNYCTENLNRVFKSVPYDELFPLDRDTSEVSSYNN
nr:PREDICTED: uncharacterized protein LOC109044223 [Bemisia tabaci]